MATSVPNRFTATQNRSASALMADFDYITGRLDLIEAWFTVVGSVATFELAAALTADQLESTGGIFFTRGQKIQARPSAGAAADASLSSPSVGVLQADQGFNVVGTLTVAGVPVAAAQPTYFRAYRSSAASHVSNTTILFNTETDPNGWYDPATGIFLPTVAGTYRVSWAVGPDAAMTLNKYLYAYLKNESGAAVRQSPPAWQVTAAAIASTLGTTLMAFNGTTNSVKVNVVHDNGGSLALDTTLLSTRFEAEYVGP